MKEVLIELGLTDGEIRVYLALIRLGKSATGNIMSKSKISSSKVYLILDRLIEKGLVSFLNKDNVKHYQPTNPESIRNLIDRKRQGLDVLEKESQPLIKALNEQMASFEEESARVYKGISGLRAAHQNIIDEYKKGEDYMFFSVDKTELEDVRSEMLYKSLHKERIKKEIIVKGIVDLKLKKSFEERFGGYTNYKMKFCPLPIPNGITIGKKRVFFEIWMDTPIGFEIVSKEIAEKYTDFFNKMWDNIQ